MNKIKLGVVFGGMSTEHDVSIVSASYVLSNLDKEKYLIFPIYIDKNGIWWECLENFEILKTHREISKKRKIETVFDCLKNLDKIFPVLHGLYGEDGSIQGLFELLKIPYVGCKILSSSIGMDKFYSKIIFEKAHINQVKSMCIKKTSHNYIYIDNFLNEEELDSSNLIQKILDNFNFPIFVKPCNSGSSVGVTKVYLKNEIIDAINYALKFDKKILIEQAIIGKEVECAILGTDDVIASTVGEIKTLDNFYSYDAKYNDKNSKTIIPANLPQNIISEIQGIAKKAFKAIGGSGLSRVDFFVEENTNKIYLNEINTMPGFTSISMYPKLFEASGVSYCELLDKLISLA